MGWFDEQIEYRKKHERELLNDSFVNIARAVTGRKTMSLLKEDADVSDAVSALLKHFGVKEKEVPRNIKGLQDRLDYLLSSTGILYREVILVKGWHKDAMGAMITTMKADGTVVALLPSELRPRSFWVRRRCAFTAPFLCIPSRSGISFTTCMSA